MSVLLSHLPMRFVFSSFFFSAWRRGGMAKAPITTSSSFSSNPDHLVLSICTIDGLASIKWVVRVQLGLLLPLAYLLFSIDMVVPFSLFLVDTNTNTHLFSSCTLFSGCVGILAAWVGGWGGIQNQSMLRISSQTVGHACFRSCMPSLGWAASLASVQVSQSSILCFKSSCI